MNEYIEKNRERFIAELVNFLKIPSVSTDPSFKANIIEAAHFVANKLKDAGAENVEICSTPFYPIVYAEKIVDPALPTVLVYGHYDVQPADPYELWDTPPFEPVIKDGKIYARGASDNKGQMYLHIKAFEVMMKHNALDCNVKFMFEGEEENGSSGLTWFIENHSQKIKTDVVLISDTDMVSQELPSITVGLRGMSYIEVEVTSANRDLHSGLYGGAVANPINALAHMIAKLKNEEGKILIPHFYDKVTELSTEERTDIARIPYDEISYRKSIGIPETTGELGYTNLERLSIRPTLDVNGIWGGYTGEGAKTVLPSKANAKISMRLVPHQQYEEITQLVTDYLHQIAPKSVTINVTAHHGAVPAVVSTQSDAYRAAAQAFKDTYDITPIAARGGGSIPIVPMFKEKLGADAIMMGFGLNSDAIHSPNEHFHIFNYMKGIETIPLFYKYFAEYSK